VTGATGALGSAVIPRLHAAGLQVRALSRRPRRSTDETHWYTGDLTTAEGIESAVAGSDTIVHCATSNGQRDLVATENLITAAQRGGRPRLLYVSIVGADRIAIPYYRTKVAVEQLIERSGLPFTVLRATQFHQLIGRICEAERVLPVFPMVRGVRFQPIDVSDVAARLVALVGSPVDGRAPDLGGPEIHDGVDLVRRYMSATGRRRPVIPVGLPGRAVRELRAGHNLVPEHAAGRVSFDDYLSTVAARRG
jgi:uncharacterized protein YbjT (DUF2867 family)